MISTLLSAPLPDILATTSLWVEYSTKGTYFLIAAGSTIFALILLALSFFGIGEVEASAGLEGVSGDVGIFSLRAITGFFLGLGWGGYISTHHFSDPSTHLICGIATGSLMFISVAILIKLVMDLQSDGTIHPENLMGLEGTVYLSIPPNSETGGQVQISHPNQLVTVRATQNGSAELKAQVRIRVIESNSAGVVVEKA